MKVSIIAAVAENGVIGKDNDLVWHLPDDFKFFVSKTKGHPVIMGRKTFESLGKPLKNRPNLMVSSNPDYSPDGVSVFQSLKDALEEAAELDKEEVFIIGGANVYKQAFEFSTHMYITKVHSSYEGDTYFPDFGEEWELIEEDPRKADEKHAVDFTFRTYKKTIAQEDK